MGHFSKARWVWFCLPMLLGARFQGSCSPLLSHFFCISAWPSSFPLWWNEEIKSYFKVLETPVRAEWGPPRLFTHCLGRKAKRWSWEEGGFPRASRWAVLGGPWAPKPHRGWVKGWRWLESTGIVKTWLRHEVVSAEGWSCTSNKMGANSTTFLANHIPDSLGFPRRRQQREEGSICWGAMAQSVPKCYSRCKRGETPVGTHKTCSRQ